VAPSPSPQEDTTVRKILFTLVALALVASACNRSSAAKQPTLTIGHVPSTVEGNVVAIPVTVKGIKIIEPNGDTSGKTGHFHVFVDRLPIKPGKVIPKGMRNIVHSAANPIMIYGLTPGLHKLHVVLGNGEHVRIDGNARGVVRVTVKGPSVQGNAPATIAQGTPLVVNLKAEGVKIVEPGTESGPGEGHYHVLVDPATPPIAGAMIPDSSMTNASPAPSSSPGMQSSMYMTGGTSQSITGLTSGEHTIWVVLADKDHKAWNPPVMDMFKVTVT
jgi:hypothetical protein